MALSGSFNTSGYYDSQAPYYLQFSWSATQDIASNTSKVSWTAKVKGGIGSGYYNTLFQRYAKVGSTVKSGENYWTVYNDTVVFSGTETIQHNNDGTGSFTAQIKVAFEVWNPNYNSQGSATFELDQIPRAAEIVSAPDFTDADSPVMTYNSPLGNLADSLQAAIYQGDSAVLCAYRDIPKTGTSYTFALTSAEIETLRNLAVTDQGITVRFYIKTVYSGTTYTNYVERTFTVTDSEDVRPNISLTLSPDNSVIPSTYRNNFSGLYIQNKTKVNAVITASGKYSASIVSYSSVFENKVYTESSFTASAPGTSGELIFTATVTDSRGYTATASVTINVLPYSKPALSNVNVFRSDTSGDPDPESTRIWIRATRSYQKMIVDGVQLNHSTLKYAFKVATSSSYVSVFTILSRTDTSDSVNRAIAQALAINIAFNVAVILQDDIGETVEYIFDIPTNQVTLHLKEGGLAVGVGKYAGADETFSVAWDSDFEGDVNVGGNITAANYIPIGSVCILESSISDPADIYGIGTWTSLGTIITGYTAWTRTA